MKFCKNHSLSFFKLSPEYTLFIYVRDSNEIHISIFSTQTAATFQTIKLEHDCGRKFDR